MQFLLTSFSESVANIASYVLRYMTCWSTLKAPVVFKTDITLSAEKLDIIIIIIIFFLSSFLSVLLTIS